MHGTEIQAVSLGDLAEGSAATLDSFDIIDAKNGVALGGVPGGGEGYGGGEQGAAGGGGGYTSISKKTVDGNVVLLVAAGGGGMDDAMWFVSVGMCVDVWCRWWKCGWYSGWHHDWTGHRSVMQSVSE